MQLLLASLVKITGYFVVLNVSFGRFKGFKGLL
jgi:hypothetical protein